MKSGKLYLKLLLKVISLYVYSSLTKIEQNLFPLTISFNQTEYIRNISS